MKTGKINEDIALERLSAYRRISETLLKILESYIYKESQPIKKEVNIAKDKRIIKKRKSKDNEGIEEDDDDDGFWMNKDFN